MSESEQHSKLLPVDDDIVVKFPAGGVVIYFHRDLLFDASQSPYNSTKIFVDKVAGYIHKLFRPLELLKEGIKAEILEPGKKWVTGKIRLRLVIEFIPDEPEKSPLDDIRKMNL